MRRTIRFAGLCLAFWVVILSAASSFAQPANPKLGRIAQSRANQPTGWSRVIIKAADSTALDDLTPIIQRAGGSAGDKLSLIHSRTAYLPNAELSALADDPLVARVSVDRLVTGVDERTSVTIGAAAVRQDLGYDGTGITVAVIDSGVARLHDDLGAATGGHRITRFVDFVKGKTNAYDDYGHGTHVAGIIAGDGYDSGGARAGVAPGVNIVAIKVLDDRGRGRISSVIAALDYVVAHKVALNIRVVNLSISAGVFESYDDDPLTLAAKRAVDAGLVVVAAAGNQGRDSQGRTQYGGITAPGNAPWVLTVGASSHMGTVERVDDTIAVFSSRGPGAVDYRAKPDLVAPGVGTESLSSAWSSLYWRHSRFLLPGTVPTSYLPYLSLSGTSMATPVVTGTVALMLQANPSLRPNQVKAILQYTAGASMGYDPLTQGAGFLNARGAVDLARFFASPNGAYPSRDGWGTRVIWGNQLVRGGTLMPDASAWAPDVAWGGASTPSGEPVNWGTDWAEGSSLNVVWGSACGGADCNLQAADDGDTVVWGSTIDDTVVWGSDGEDTVVWGSDVEDTVVWGSDGEDTVVWGSSCSDPSCEPVVWGPQE